MKLSPVQIGRSMIDAAGRPVREFHAFLSDIITKLNALEPLTGSKTFDPPSIANAAQTSTTVTVTGVKLGMFVQASFDKTLSGVTLSAYVSAADTVTCVFLNMTGGAVDLPSGKLAVRVNTG